MRWPLSPPVPRIRLERFYTTHLKPRGYEHLIALGDHEELRLRNADGAILSIYRNAKDKLRWHPELFQHWKDFNHV